MADHLNLGGNPTKVATLPSRLHFNRFAGLALPEGAKLITRITRFGSPFTVAACGSNQAAVEKYIWFLDMRRTAGPDWVNPYPNYPSDEQIREQLAGWNLACACKVAEPWCHGDPLIVLANSVPEAIR